jgi:hypothetical protein
LSDARLWGLETKTVYPNRRPFLSSDLSGAKWKGVVNQETSTTLHRRNV